MSWHQSAERQLGGLNLHFTFNTLPQTDSSHGRGRGVLTVQPLRSILMSEAVSSHAGLCLIFFKTFPQWSSALLCGMWSWLFDGRKQGNWFRRHISVKCALNEFLSSTPWCTVFGFQWWGLQTHSQSTYEEILEKGSVPLPPPSCLWQDILRWGAVHI